MAFLGEQHFDNELPVLARSCLFEQLEFIGVDAYCDGRESVFFDQEEDVVDHVEVEGAFDEGGQFVLRKESGLAFEGFASAFLVGEVDFGVEVVVVVYLFEIVNVVIFGFGVFVVGGGVRVLLVDEFDGFFDWFPAENLEVLNFYFHLILYLGGLLRLSHSRTTLKLINWPQIRPYASCRR